jgi:hydrogenase/urease accessory protein HupE
MLAAAGVSAPAAGHALQPGYLALRQIDAAHFAVLWKVPDNGGRPLSIAARLPVNCAPRASPQLRWDGSAYLARWQSSCPGGLAGGAIDILGLENMATDVLVRLDFDDGTSQAHRLTPAHTRLVVPVAPGTLEVVQTYLLYGVEHILLGFDHLLFVLALLILVNGVRRLVATVTAFTVAHSITLAGATLGFVHVPGPPVEAAIALSIAFVAAEVVHGRGGRAGLTERFPWVIAFVFGLLHGFGFAGALAQIGLPQQSIPMALLFFNVGVELGQLLFIGAALAGIALLRRVAKRVGMPKPSWGWTVPPYAIGSLAAFWVIQRVAQFVS